jgi:hypothetical protein
MYPLFIVLDAFDVGTLLAHPPGCGAFARLTGGLRFAPTLRLPDVIPSGMKKTFDQTLLLTPFRRGNLSGHRLN